MQAKHVQHILQQLSEIYPAATRHNYLFFSQIKTKGVLDDKRELIVWILALCIFVPISLVMQQKFEQFFELSSFQALSYSVLTLALFFMLVVPFIIYQIKHASNSLYQLQQSAPIKLTIVIILHALNMLFLQNLILVWLALFFTVSFSFVRLYKENLFRESTTTQDYFQLQQVRRMCFWAYKQAMKTKIKMRFCSQQSAHYALLKKSLVIYADLHTQLFKLEHQYCKQIKYIDLETYLDEIS